MMGTAVCTFQIGGSQLAGLIQPTSYVQRRERDLHRMPIFGKQNRDNIKMIAKKNQTVSFRHATFWKKLNTSKNTKNVSQKN